MSTNFYWVTDEVPCPTCGHHKEERKHIGKSSGGWAFALRVYPEEGINCLQDWARVWEGKGHVENEHGDRMTVAEMRNWIITRSHPHQRHSLCEGHCIGYERTWDLIEGEFS
jgi:hypothetical protein